jgi:hypothetical protein
MRRKATFYPVAASFRVRTVIVGGNTRAVDVLWVSTGFFVGVIDMAVVL